MDFMTLLPPICWLIFVFLAGLAVGSFLNVLIARLPYEKSIIWPGSRCFSCLQPLKLADNLPILGYLRLRGRCRQCGAGFSSRYLWVELFTGIAFVALFCVDVLSHASSGPEFVKPWHAIPGLKFSLFAGLTPLPPIEGLIYFVYHAILISLLITAALIDAEHRIIPPQVTYTGVLIGLIGSTLLAWPWPSLDVDTLTKIASIKSWILPEEGSKIPTGAMLWPCWPPPSWAPVGSWKLGLLNGVVGALFGTFLVRAIKFLFEIGLGREALGLGDADLMMMAGAFLGWQVVLLGFFAGAVAALLIKVILVFASLLQKRTADGELALGREMSFGPGLAIGVVAVWMGWPWLGDFVRPLYEPTVLVVIGSVIGGGILVAGLILRRK
jgi:leader peptidase (prepilin peptidase) / N-methyltransferase